FFYTQVARVDRRKHAVDRYFKLAETFGAPLRDDLRFPIPTGDQPPRFNAFPGFVVLHPYARGRNKSIGASVILEFCRALAPARVVVVGKSGRRFRADRGARSARAGKIIHDLASTRRLNVRHPERSRRIPLRNLKGLASEFLPRLHTTIVRQVTVLRMTTRSR